MLAENGALADMIAAGARIIECGCGPCIGMGQSPKTNAVSLQNKQQKFYGRSGTKSASIYLVSPEVAAVAAITGVVTDPADFGEPPVVEMPDSFLVSDNMVIIPSEKSSDIEVVRGPNIKPFPMNHALGDTVEGKVLIKLEDNITTDHIMPSNSKLLPYRSNVPYLCGLLPDAMRRGIPARAKANNGGFIIGGENYGQGSSREHAALAPLQLGIKGVISLSFARIHMANLINNGILPLVFAQKEDYDRLGMLDELVVENAADQVRAAVNGKNVTVTDKTQGFSFETVLNISERQCGMLLAGGLLNYTRENA